MLFFPVAVAFAEGGGPTGPSGIMSFAPLVFLFVIFYFLLIRPQQKRSKEHKEMLTKVAVNDNIITSGGIHGRVTAVQEETVTAEISDKVRVKVSKGAISSRKTHNEG